MSAPVVAIVGGCAEVVSGEVQVLDVDNMRAITEVDDAISTVRFVVELYGQPLGPDVHGALLELLDVIEAGDAS